ncbi:phosphatidylserine synthase [Parabacteroides sp. PFB2-10]|uniref:hypothetical protein n=1 Tax=Parabacteroides sp. PFB2-10 TaxID=1742405 RepID=UPI002475A3C1|nr:hypothetical protein [Parabacteroides sp. PFB2-10]MDH6311316.1 phosphatidylserine synthase [Parabacteroides sp. PFB2-10]MDL2244698.1 hypothetical protein [Parabacteroides sp. OttesenSCG-928-J18]
MKSSIRNIIYMLAALLLLAGAVLHFTQWAFAPYLFAFGAAGLTVSYLTVSPKGMDFRHKRLHNFNMIAGLLMIVASGLMFSQRKEWVILLLIAAILQGYVAFVWKEEKKEE